MSTALSNIPSEVVCTVVLAVAGWVITNARGLTKKLYVLGAKRGEEGYQRSQQMRDHLYLPCAIAIAKLDGAMIGGPEYEIVPLPAIRAVLDDQHQLADTQLLTLFKNADRAQGQFRKKYDSWTDDERDSYVGEYWTVEDVKLRKHIEVMMDRLSGVMFFE